MPYLLDANVLIQAKNLHYGLDFCPGFWEWLIRSNAAGLVFSIEKVLGEIEAGDDALSGWAKARGSAFFLGPTPEMATSLRTVAAWAKPPRYEQGAVDMFLRVGDYYLVSHAHALNYSVVTHEVPALSRRKIKIPDVCLGLGIRCLTPFEMLRNERARFVLPPSLAAGTPAGG